MENLIYITIFLIILFVVVSIMYFFLLYKKLYKKERLDDSDGIAGFLYDEKQDIFYSDINAWQRNYGYCNLYDEMAPPLSMIVDMESIVFDYNGKRWLIEFWKGQYGMTYGGEVGVYNKDINSTVDFYDAARDEEMLYIAYNLYKDNEKVFYRKGVSWWLTSFKLGGFAQPYEISMNIVIQFKDALMLNAFLNSLKNVGYKEEEYIVNGNFIRIRFNHPYSRQATTRNEYTDMLIQKKNKFLCDEYNKLTKNMSQEEKTEYFNTLSKSIKVNEKIMMILYEINKEEL